MLDRVLRNQSSIKEGLGSPEPESLGGKNTEPLRRSRLAEGQVSATGVGNNMSRKRRKLDSLHSSSPDAHFSNVRDIGDEPFLRLFENLDNSKACNHSLQGNVRDGQAGLSANGESTHHILRELRLQIPNSEELKTILQAERSTLKIWSGAFPDALGAAESVSPERLQDHIYRCLHSDNTADAAKLMLCLALHIQQLPNDLETTLISLPAPLEDLQEYYMTSAEGLLSSDEHLGGTLSGLECMILQSEFYINAGNLQKVWLVVRRAVNIAQLLGLHRKVDADVGTGLAMRRNAIWTELWHRERGFSLILGLPYSTLDSQMPPSTLNDDVSDLQRTKRFLRDLSIVMRQIVDRDQDPSGKTYSVTLKIEEELEECKNIMSARWWNFTPDAATPTDAVGGMFVAKLRFYTVQRLLHLPFLLKAFKERRFESSRLSTLKSSREIINVYNVLRDEKRPVLKMCDMVDFQVFAAAMTLVVDLLACSRTPDHCDLHREERDWQLVFETAKVLGQLSRSRKGCQVAALGARVLDDFSQLRNGSAEGAIKVDIPYFGRVEIRQRDARQNEHISHTHLSSQTNHQAQIEQDPSAFFEGPVESVVSLDSFLFPLPAASQPLQEADESWTHMLDTSMTDDWSWFPGGVAN